MQSCELILAIDNIIKWIKSYDVNLNCFKAEYHVNGVNGRNLLANLS